MSCDFIVYFLFFFYEKHRNRIVTRAHTNKIQIRLLLYYYFAHLWKFTNRFLHGYASMDFRPVGLVTADSTLVARVPVIRIHTHTQTYYILCYDDDVRWNIFILFFLRASVGENRFNDDCIVSFTVIHVLYI